MKYENLTLYRVKKGDTLNSIAERYKISPTEILIQNAIVPKNIREGFVLEIKKRIN